MPPIRLHGVNRENFSFYLNDHNFVISYVAES